MEIPMEGLCFVEHRKVNDEVYAHFIDRQEGLPAVLSYENCVERLRNLKKNGFPHEETQKALDTWPKPNGGGRKTKKGRDSVAAFVFFRPLIQTSSDCRRR